MWKYLVVFVLFAAAAGAGAAWVLASRAPGPVIAITGSEAIGQTGELDVAIETPGGELKSLEVTLEQDDTTLPIFSLAARILWMPKYVIVWPVKNCMGPPCNGPPYFTNMTSDLRKASII